MEQNAIKTVQFLNAMAKAGYTKVCIGTVNRNVPQTLTFPAGWDLHSVFGYPEVTHNDWPAIWHVCRELGIHQGCANSHQVQVTPNVLRRGYYEQVGNNNWTRISD